MLSHPDAAALRADAYRNLRAVAEVLRNHMDWATRLSRPTHARLMALTGLGRRTVARWVAWLRARGLLGVATPGSTPGTRPGGSVDGQGNLAAEYVLAVPDDGQDGAEGGQVAEVVSLPVNGTGSPSQDLSGSSDPYAGARAREGHQSAAAWHRTAPSRTKRDQLRACERLRRESLTLRRISGRHLRSILRDVLRAGATPADVLYMLDHRPDGTPWTYTSAPRHVPGWLRHRLAAWHGADGELLVEALPSRRVLAVRAEIDQAAAARRAEREELAAGRAVDVAGRARAARELLAAGSAAAAAVMRRRAVIERPGVFSPISRL